MRKKNYVESTVDEYSDSSNLFERTYNKQTKTQLPKYCHYCSKPFYDGKNKKKLNKTFPVSSTDKKCQNKHRSRPLKNINYDVDIDMREKTDRIISWIQSSRYEQSKKPARKRQVNENISLQTSSSSEIVKPKKLRNRNNCRSSSEDQSKSSQVASSLQAYGIKTRSKAKKLNENFPTERVIQSSKQPKLDLRNDKVNCDKNVNFSDEKHTVRIKLNGQIICDKSIILEITFANNGWKIVCEEPENLSVKCVKKPGYKIANFDILINPKNSNEITTNEQKSVDNYYRATKNNSNKINHQSEEKPMVDINSDNEEVKRILNVSVKSMLNKLEDTTILNTLFSSNETLLGETKQDCSKLKVKTIQEINNAIETIVINDDESEKALSTSEVVTKFSKIKKKRKECPDFKLIKDTPFAVDAFSYGDLVSQGVETYFLTHFHSDHYIGMSKKFSRPVYCSQITANLIELRIKVDKKYINVLELNKTAMINNIEVTALDANHCPGSIMLLFKVSDKYIMHTGDFRANYEMELIPQLQNIQVDRLYLDTTYCKRQYVFPTQEDSINIATNIIKKSLIKDDCKKTLIVVGSYLIGKEKMWLGLSKALFLKVWLEESRYDLIRAFENDSLYLENVVTDPREAGIHVIPCMHLNIEKLNEHLEKFSDTYEHIIAIRPSGWEHKKKPYTIGNITIAGVAYSEHSSYEELKRFVSFLKPKKIIATAGNLNQLPLLYKDCGIKDPSLNTLDKYFKKKFD